MASSHCRVLRLLRPSESGTCLESRPQAMSAVRRRHDNGRMGIGGSKIPEASTSTTLVHRLYKQGALSSQFDHGYMALLLAAEVALGLLIIRKVAYTEIDWVAYMQEVEGYLGGERDYLKIRGDTGASCVPIVVRACRGPSGSAILTRALYLGYLYRPVGVSGGILVPVLPAEALDGARDQHPDGAAHLFGRVRPDAGRGAAAVPDPNPFHSKQRGFGANGGGLKDPARVELAGRHGGIVPVQADALHLLAAAVQRRAHHALIVRVGDPLCTQPVVRRMRPVLSRGFRQDECVAVCAGIVAAIASIVAQRMDADLEARCGMRPPTIGAGRAFFAGASRLVPAQGL
jgi:ALG3 protein